MGSKPEHRDVTYCKTCNHDVVTVIDHDSHNELSPDQVSNITCHLVLVQPFLDLLTFLIGDWISNYNTFDYLFQLPTTLIKLIK